jgi:DNA gyrase/topoisomerase IV subunit B
MNNTPESPSKEIIALSDFEHVLLSPTMYVGTIEPIDESVRIIKNGIIETTVKPISTGFYKLMNEVLDNSFDEAKRMDGSMTNISISFDSKTNRVTVSDTGNGFFKGTEINDKTGLTNVETAMTMLRAGSNFKNQGIQNSLLGTHGIGASVVNMLSDEFEVHSINDTHSYHHIWKKFETFSKEIKPKKRSDVKGTTISFIPRTDKFENYKWDFEYIEAQMIFKDFIRKNDPYLSKIKFEVKFDDVAIDLTKKFIPEENFTVDSKIGQFILWEHPDNGFKSTSFINTAMCTGIHQTIITDKINDLLDYKWGNVYFDIFFVMNLPPKHVKWDSQNKTKYAVGRWEIEPIIEKHFGQDIERQFPKTEIFKRIKQKIKENIEKDEIQSLKKALRNKAKKVVSDKYFPPTDKKGTLFIVEGESALGSLMQKRKPETDGVYRLKGKIKNAKSVSDLTKNAEIIDLMNILGLEPKGSTKCTFDKIIIATDWDPDGVGHIASLLINLFFKWFKFIIEQDKLFILITPLVSADVGKERKYFYSTKEFGEYSKTTTDRFSNTRYLKGLGSLSVDDWETIMKKRDCYRIYADRSAYKFLYMAFDGSANNRKKWLEGSM